MSFISLSLLPDRPVTSTTEFRSVADGVTKLTTLFAFQRELIRHSAAWLPAVPYWDAKVMIGQHILEEAEGAEAILKRLHELKAASAEHKQISHLDKLMRECASAGSADEWMQGLYTCIKQWFIELLQDYLEFSDPIMDAPSHEVVRKMIAVEKLQVSWFQQFTPRFSNWEQPDTSEWRAYLESILRETEVRADQIIGNYTRCRPGNRPDFQVPEQIRRDRCFRASEQTQYPEEGETFEEKRFLVFWNHTQEMQFAESLCAILFETAEMPWAFHYDLARHLADEVRHASMGQSRLEQLGINFSELPMKTQNYTLRANLDPLERFCLMTLVMEAGSFERKRANQQLFEKEGDCISALYESYDIRDEMLHTNFGHLWVPIMLRVYHDARSSQGLIQQCREIVSGLSTPPKGEN